MTTNISNFSAPSPTNIINTANDSSGDDSTVIIVLVVVYVMLAIITVAIIDVLCYLKRKKSKSGKQTPHPDTEQGHSLELNGLTPSNEAIEDVQKHNTPNRYYLGLIMRCHLIL